MTQYPNDAITYSTEIAGALTEIVYNGGDSTILAVAMQQSNMSSDTTIRCGGDEVAKNYATNYSNVTMNYQCEDGAINILKSGNDDAFIVITYVPYLTGDYSTTTPWFSPLTENSSTSDIYVLPQYTAGDIVISSMLFLLILLTLARYLALALSKIQTKKTFLQYGGGDVEIRKDL